ncbi:hypothetical protein HY491_00185 [Candidatus Woesearchaeota archaeon]|nr:hypothetical protein [Candidatus Woesearchaeota archaeon]
MDKRGQVDDWIEFIVVMLGLGVIVLFFFGLIAGKEQRAERDFAEEKARYEATQYLLRFLQEQATVQGETISGAEFVLRSRTPPYDGLFRAHLLEYFSQRLSAGWRMKITIDGMPRNYEPEVQRLVHQQFIEVVLPHPKQEVRVQLGY